MFYDYSLIDKVGLNCVFFWGEGEVSKSVSGGNHRTYLHNFAITCSTYSRSSVKCTEENPWSSSFMYITHCWMCNIFLLEDKPNISLMSLAGLREAIPALEIIWKQSFIFGVKHELPLALKALSYVLGHAASPLPAQDRGPGATCPPVLPAGAAMAQLF